MILWPESLPKPTVDFNIEADTSVVRTPMDSGRIRQRQRFTRDFRKMRVTWQFTDTEFGFFQSIYRHALSSGAEWFTINLPMGDDIKEYTARFVADSYAAKYNAVMNWDVSVILETEDETAPYSADDTDALLAVDFDIDAFESAADVLYHYTHVILPTLMPA